MPHLWIIHSTPEWLKTAALAGENQLWETRGWLAGQRSASIGSSAWPLCLLGFPWLFSWQARVHCSSQGQIPSRAQCRTPPPAEPPTPLTAAGEPSNSLCPVQSAAPRNGCQGYNDVITSCFQEGRGGLCRNRGERAGGRSLSHPPQQPDPSDGMHAFCMQNAWYSACRPCVGIPKHSTQFVQVGQIN